MEKLGSYRILDRHSIKIVKNINGLKKAREYRDGRNKEYHSDIPKNSNDWRYCIFKGDLKDSFMDELKRL